MRRVLLAVIATAILPFVLPVSKVVHGQTGLKVPLTLTQIPGISSSWPGEGGAGCSSGVIVNTSTISRRNNYHSVTLTTGTGVWSAAINFSDAACSGPWTSFGSAATITQASSPAVAFGNGYHPWIQIVITGNAVVGYSGQNQLGLSTSSGSVSFPITIPQGGTGAGTSAGALANLLQGNSQGTYTNKIQMAGANSGTSGSVLCNDGSGNTTTSGCSVSPAFNASDYNFPPQTPGGSLVIGGNTITLAPCPVGMNGTDANHYAEIVGGVGAAEPVPITGGTCTSGATTGTVIVTAAGTHTGAWTFAPSNGGGSEAIWACPSTGCRVTYPAGTVTVHAPIKRRSLVPLWIQGQGNGVTTLAVASDFPNLLPGVNGVIDWTGGGLGIPEGGGADFTISFIQPDSTNVGTYTHWKPAIYITGGYFSTWENISLVAAWDGAVMTGNNNGAFFSHIVGSYFHRFFDLQGASGTGFDTVDVERTQATTTGLTSNQATAFLAVGTGNVGFYVGTVNDLNIRGSEINSVLAADFHTGGDGSAAGVHLSDIWWEGQTTVSDGTIDIVNMHTSGGVVGSAVYLAQTGGFVKISNSRLFYRGTNAAISATASASTVAVPIPGLQISNSYFDLGASDVSAVVVTAGAPYTGVFNVNTSNCQFSRTAGGTYSTATITATNGTGDVRLTATGNTFYPNAGGTGTAINLGSDNYHVITGNQGGGWSYSVGASPAKTQWANNLNFVANTSTFQDPVSLQNGTAAATAGAATLAKQSGTITSESITTAAGSTYTLTLTNSKITTASQIYANAFLGTSTQGLPQVVSATPGSGSAVVLIKNVHATLAFNGTIKIQFLVF